MGQNDLTFWRMFAKTLFNRQKNMFVFIFISQISYKQVEFTVLNQEQVHTIAKHGTEVINRMFWFFKYTF